MIECVHSLRGCVQPHLQQQQKAVGLEMPVTFHHAQRAVVELSAAQSPLPVCCWDVFVLTLLTSLAYGAEALDYFTAAH